MFRSPPEELWKTEEFEERVDMASNCGFTCLPEDFVVEILKRLPVKTLLRVKSVCKLWYNLIKSPSFISQHYHHSNNLTDLVFHRCVDVDRSDVPNNVFSIYRDETPARHQDLDYPNMTEILKVVGPVNGLFLLMDKKFKLDLWNPAIRESRTISELNPNLPKHFVRYISTLGFGMDPVTHDYKVIYVQFYWDSIQQTRESVLTNHGLLVPAIGVYSFADDSWNLLDPNVAKFPSNVDFKGLPYNLNGDQYWTAFSYKTNRHTIFTFDMKNEVFGEVRVPSGVTEGWLSLYNDDIVLYSLVKNTNRIDAWVMEVEGCWTKIFAIDNLPELLRPIRVWKSNELIFQNRSLEFVFYNLSTRKTGNTGIRGFQHGYGVFCYKESFFSVNSGFKIADSRGLFGMLRDFLINKASGILVWVWSKA